MATRKYKPGKDGTYSAKVWDGTYNADGSKHRINLRSKKSSGDLERKVNEFRRLVAEGLNLVRTTYTFGEYAQHWLDTYKSICAPNTRNMYRNIIDKHLYEIADYQLTDIRRSHYQFVINEAANMPRTCQQLVLTFRQIIKAAMSDKYLPSTSIMDICDGVTVPNYRASEKRPLTKAEKEAILKADFTDREKAFVFIIYGCGLRRGEALALDPVDINFKAHSIAVNKSLAFDGNDYYIKSTKSENGERIVPMPAYLSAYLATYIKNLKTPWLFARRDGGRMTKSAYDKMWASIVRKLNKAAGGTDSIKVIHDLTAHVFRHNYCTSLCYQVPDISLKRIATLMGDTLKMVMTVYNHLMEEQQDIKKTVEKALDICG